MTDTKIKRGRPVGSKTKTAEPRSHVEVILEALEKRVETGLSDMELTVMMVLLETHQSKGLERKYSELLGQWTERLENMERFINNQQSIMAMQTKPRSPGPPVGPPRQTPMGPAQQLTQTRPLDGQAR